MSLCSDCKIVKSFITIRGKEILLKWIQNYSEERERAKDRQMNYPLSEYQPIPSQSYPPQPTYPMRDLSRC